MRVPRGERGGTGGAWWPFAGRAMLRCPWCGFECYLPHDIAADGTVTPSAVCPRDGCDFHDWITLEGWI